MKRFLCLILGIMCGITLCFAGFCVPKTQKTTHAEEIKNFEDLIQNKQDIIGTSGSFSGVTAVSNAAPFDRETKAMMTGNAYKFSANAKGEINAKINFKTNGTPFTVKVDESAYVWLYFPEVTLFELKLGFYTDDGKGMYWHFDTNELISELNNNGKKSIGYGWRLFELKFTDATLVMTDSIYDDTYNIFEVVYQRPDEVDDSLDVEESLSFYHLYKAKSLKNTGVCYYQDYTIYQLKDTLQASLDSMFEDDSLKFNGIYDVFEYVIVGNKDLRNYSDLQHYTWKIMISDDNGETETIKYGEEYTFEDIGWYSVNVKLMKQTTSLGVSKEDVVLNTSSSFYVDRFGIGAFSGDNYFYTVGSKHAVKFTIVDEFVFDSDIVVSVDNKKIATATYYVEGNICYVEIELKRIGSTTITLSAEGHREGTTDSETYSRELHIHVVSGEKETPKWLLWTCFGVFCAVIVVYLTISFVKARRFGVK